MTTLAPATAPVDRKTGVFRFTRHFIEMVVAMIVGMAALGALWGAVVSASGTEFDSFTDDHVVLVALAMAFDMTVAMVLWMRYRGHNWARGAEMGGAMFAPTFVVICMLEFGATSADALIGLQHAVMLPAMLVVMLWRRSEYTRAHRPGPHRRLFRHPAGRSRRLTTNREEVS
jgi:hypothetical protein